jgi:DNA adenine methylase
MVRPVFIPQKMKIEAFEELGSLDGTGLMKTPISYYGGKQTMLKHLLQLVPQHEIYCEPFFGGGALFFAKEKSDVEIINDSNGEVVNFFKIVKTKFSELQREIKGTLHSRELYKKAMVVYEHPAMFSEVQRAWAFWTLTNQGFASMIGSWGFGKSNSKEKSLSNKREDFTKEYAERLKMAQIESNDALKVIARADSKETFFYIDPPYIGSDMGHYSGYSEAEYEKLLSALVKVKGKFLLSSYPSTILTRFIRKHKWKTKRVEKFIAVTKHTDKKKVEMLVYNFDPTKTKMMNTDKPLSGTDDPEINRAKNDAKQYWMFELDMLERLLRMEEDAFNEYGDLPEIKIRKKALIKEINQRKKAGAGKLEGTGSRKKREELFKGIIVETQLIRRFLDFHNKVLYRNTFEIFLEELQRAIEEKKITRKSPVAKEIMEIQNAVVSAYNGMKSAKHFVLKPGTIKRLNKALEKHENAYFEEEDKPALQIKKKARPLEGIETPEPASDGKIMSSVDFAKEEFSTIGFKDKWLDFIGDPAPGFTAMVFGPPKMGKSYLCVDFAGYLARNHGKVLYVSKEEKLDATLQKKLTDKDVAHPNLFVSDFLPEDLSPYDFIILDSVNKLGLSAKDLENLKVDNKGKSFVFIFQTTKEGKFRGTNEFQHDVDVVIEVPEPGKAVQFGRFNQGGELSVFNEPTNK